MKTENRTVDVIIPVYQGYEETLTCLESALRSRAHNQTQMNLIVINDAGPDRNLTMELEKRAELGEFALYHNEINKGFVGTVNRGMAMTQNDVVLLNSDAEVASDWLDKMRHHVYDHAQTSDTPKVASVTPFSNNATICSYPVFCAQNPMPAGETVASMDAFCAQANAGQSIELPTAVGFCMYITRESLNALGLFDEEAFGRGYGEENDFCARAIKAGYVNLFALDTFAKHEGGVSFAEDQSPLQQRAGKVLAKKHPEYDAWVSDHVFHNPAHRFRVRVDLLRFSQSALPLVLCVLHAHGGGTEKHVEDLANALSGQANVVALKPDANGHWRLFAPARGEAFVLVFKRSQTPELMRLLGVLNVSRVHFHHLLGLDDDILALPVRLGVPYDFTAHDYYTINKDVHLLGDDARVDKAQIDSVKDFLFAASRLFAPSVDASERLNQAFPAVTFHAVSHPDTIIDRTPNMSVVNFDERPIRVLLIGGLGREKGADVLANAVDYAKAKGLPIQFHLFGYTYQSLSTTSNLMVYGKFEQRDLATLIAKVNPHWIWFPAQTPETYSYTLSAAMASSCAILASDLGALPERLAHYDKSKLLPWDSEIEDWCAAMQQCDFDAIDSRRKQADAFSTASYLSIISREQKQIDTEILDFDQFLEDNEGYRFDWSVHGVKVAVLRSLVWLKHRPWVAKLINRVPVGVQLRVKNWLLGARR